MNSIYNTLFEMMEDRGYSTEKKCTNNIEIDDFNIIFTKGDTACNIFYINNAKVGINHIKSVIESIDTKNCNHALVIYSLVVTSFAKQFLESTHHNIELFHENELLKNITKHYLVPNHRLLEKLDIVILLKNLQIKKSNLPKVKKHDPISKYYGAKTNDVFEITRYDNSIKSLYYRIVY